MPLDATWLLLGMRRLAGTAVVLLALSGATGCSSLESAADTFCTFNSCPDISPPGNDGGGPGLDATVAADTEAAADASDAQDTQDTQDAPSDAPRLPWWCEANGSAQTRVDPLPAPNPKPMKVRYRFQIFDFGSAVNNLPRFVTNLTFISCTNSDPGCVGVDAGTVKPPLAVTTPTMTAPYYQIDLPYGFSGSIRITSPGYIPTQYFFGGPLVGMPSGAIDTTDGTLLIQGAYITPITEADADRLYQQLGMVARDPNLGLLGARLLDCNGDRAAFAFLKVTSPTGLGYSLVQNLPVLGDPPQTDSRAVAGYVNMAVRNYFAEGLTPNGGSYGRNTPTVIEANTLTILEIRTDQSAFGR